LPSDSASNEPDYTQGDEEEESEDKKVEKLASADRYGDEDKKESKEDDYEYDEESGSEKPVPVPKKQAQQ